MSKMKFFAMMAVVAILFSAGVIADQSKYDSTGTTSREVLFGVSPTGYKVTGLYCVSDAAASTVDFYTASGSGRNPIVTASTSGAQVIYIDNPAHACSTNDVVVYVHSDGTLLKTTVASSTTNSVTLAAGISKAGTTSDYLFEVAATYALPVGSSAALNPNGDIYAVPPSSPLWVTLGSGTTATLAVSTDL